MRIEQTYYGDYIVRDELPFSGRDILRATYKVIKHYNVNVWYWPVTVDFNETTDLWEVMFIRPATDEELSEGVFPLP